MTLTRQLLEGGVPVIYEGSFRAGGVFVAVDILARDARGLRLIEVKSSASVKEHHIPDVAIQANVLRQSGLDLAARCNRRGACGDCCFVYVCGRLVDAAHTLAGIDDKHL